jgi:hypothetical protein
MPEARFPRRHLLGNWVYRGRPGPVTQAGPVRYVAAMLGPVYRKGIVLGTPARAPRIYRSATFEASPTKGMLVGHRPAFTWAFPIRVSLGACINFPRRAGAPRPLGASLARPEGKR